jgi:hypothetical protein
VPVASILRASQPAQCSIRPKPEEGIAMPHRIRRLAVDLAAVLAIAGLGSVAAASAGTVSPGTGASRSATLINVPAARICHYHRFKVGVWAQPGTSRANRRYVVNVYNPSWVRVLHRFGHAPTSYWLFWHPRVGKLGRYHTIYKTWNNGVLYRNKYVTKSVRC